jgi:Tfp pilus assembly protein PilO
MSWLTIKRTDRSSFIKIDAAGLSACLVLSAAAYVIGVRPLLAVREERVAQEQSLRSAMEQANSLVSSTRALRTQLSNAQSALTKIEIPLLSASAMNLRVAELTSLAGDCHIEVQAIQPGAISSAQRYAQIPIQIAASGTYRATAEFLHRLRAQFPDTAVRTFELSSTPDATGSAVANFSVELVWYVQPAPADPKQR